MQLTDVSWSGGFQSFKKQVLKATWYVLQCGWFGFPQDMLLFPVKVFGARHEAYPAVAC